MKKCLAILIYTFLSFTSSATHQSDQSFDITLSNPGKPVILEFSHGQTDLKISGYEGKKIKIEVFKKKKKIKLNEYPITYSENQNKVILTNISLKAGYEFRIQVPYNTGLNLRVDWGSSIEIDNIIGDARISTSTTDISVNNLTGDLDIRTFSGDIFVSDLKGSPLIYSTKGDITLSFKTLPDNYPNILDSTGGVITLFLSDSAKASLRIRFDVPTHGKNKLSSDFILQPLNPASFPMGKQDRTSIYRSINGGGTPIYLKTFKGKIKILDLGSLK